jgi:hypothetical protein
LLCFQIGKCIHRDDGLKAALWWVELECEISVRVLLLLYTNIAT